MAYFQRISYPNVVLLPIQNSQSAGAWKVERLRLRPKIPAVTELWKGLEPGFMSCSFQGLSSGAHPICDMRLSSLLASSLFFLSLGPLANFSPGPYGITLWAVCFCQFVGARIRQSWAPCISPELQLRSFSLSATQVIKSCTETWRPLKMRLSGDLTTYHRPQCHQAAQSQHWFQSPPARCAFSTAIPSGTRQCMIQCYKKCPCQAGIRCPNIDYSHKDHQTTCKTVKHSCANFPHNYIPFSKNQGCCCPGRTIVTPKPRSWAWSDLRYE